MTFETTPETLPVRAGDAARPPSPRALLHGGSPGVLLARLVEGDPLGVRPRVARHLRREALFLDADRVHLRALSLCALEAARAPRNGHLDDWLEERVARGARAVLREDLDRAAAGPRAAAEGVGAAGVDQDALDVLAAGLRLDPWRARAACLALSVRPLEERLAVQALLVERASLDAVATAFGASASEIARRARRALDAALAALGPSSAPSAPLR